MEHHGFRIFYICSTRPVICCSNISSLLLTRTSLYTLGLPLCCDQSEVLTQRYYRALIRWQSTPHLVAEIISPGKTSTSGACCKRGSTFRSKYVLKSAGPQPQNSQNFVLLSFRDTGMLCVCFFTTRTWDFLCRFIGVVALSFCLSKSVFFGG